MQRGKKIFFKITLFFAGLFLLPTCTLFAHTLNYDLSTFSKSETGLLYLKLGYTHILPLGFDHVLFVLGLFFLNPKLKVVIWQATAFTVAHSITLALAMFGFIHPISSIVEPIIALSIFFIAVENILIHELKWWRILIVFLFGLIHGCGFASALSDLGLPEKNYFLAILTFNAGVELGQITVILIAYYLVGKWFAEKEWYRQRVVIPVSLVIGCIALFWTIERAFLI
jgi:hypothetical protein